jgi:hypothetical protein
MFNRNNPTIIIGTPQPPEEEEESCFKVAFRFAAWSLLALVIIGGAITFMSGGTDWLVFDHEGLIGVGGLGSGNSRQGTEGQPGGEGERNTEGGAAPTFTPAPPGDENQSSAPTPAVIFPTAVPSATPWVYPAPSQPTPTLPAPSPGESACPSIEGEIVWLAVRVDGVTPGCLSIASWQRIGLVSYLNEAVEVSLGDTRLSLAPGQSGEFSEPVSSLLSPGANQLQVGLYGAVEVWLVAGSR